jgi:hypothetical protein
MPDSNKPHAADDQDAIQASQDKFRADVRDENVEGADAAEAQRIDEVKSTLEADQAAFREGQTDATQSPDAAEADAAAADPKNFPADSTQESRAADLAGGAEGDSALQGVFTKEGSDTASESGTDVAATDATTTDAPAADAPAADATTADATTADATTSDAPAADASAADATDSTVSSEDAASDESEEETDDEVAEEIDDEESRILRKEDLEEKIEELEDELEELEEE